jgi:trans-aconitate 2-methyltransferase
MDSSSEMIARAQQTLPGIVFKVDDLRTYMPSEPVDLIFSNAVLQWLAADDRIPILTRLIRSQPSGGVFALQIPDNFHEPCHVAMRETAAQGCWATKLAALQLAREVPSPRELYDAVQPLCSQVDIWHTYYHHILDDNAAMVEWMKATGLRPFLAPLDDEERLGFLAAYLERLKESYRPLCDGKIMLNFPRLFLVAVRR